MSSSKGGFVQKSIDLMVFGYDFEVSSINAQKINIIGGLVVNDAHNNVKIGTDAGLFLTSGYNNVLLGNNSGYYLTTGYSNVSIGDLAGYSLNDNFNNVYLGNSAAKYGSGDENVAIGTEAGRGLTPPLAGAMGNYNVFLGNQCGYTGPNDYTTALGYQSGYNLGYGSTQNALLGYRCGYNTTSASQSTMIGVEAGYNTTTGSDVVVITDANKFLNVRWGPVGIPAINTLTLVTATYTSATFAAQLKTQLQTLDATFNVVATGNILRITLGTAAHNFQFLLKTGANGTDNANNCLSTVISPGGVDTAVIPSSGVGNYLDVAVKRGRLVFNGFRAGYYNNGADNVMIGTNAGKGSATYTASSCVYIGNGCCETNGGGNFNVAIGYECGKALQATGLSSVLIGYQCGLALTTGDTSVLIGYQAGKTITTGSSNTMIGNLAGSAALTSASSVVAIGTSAGLNVGSSFHVCIGVNAGKGTSSWDGLGSVYIGADCGASLSGVGNGANVAIGYQCGTALTTGDYSVLIGYQAGKTITTGSSNTCIGNSAASLAAVGVRNVVALGTSAAQNVGVTVADVGPPWVVSAGLSDHVCIGVNAGKGAAAWTGLGSVYIGKDCGVGLSGVAHANVAIGYEAGKALTSGGGNVLLGYQAGVAMLTATNNVAIGRLALSSGSAASTGNVIIGDSAGLNAGATDMVCIGKNAGKGSANYTGGNSIFIGTGAGGSVLGGLTDSNVCIGTSAGILLDSSGGGTPSNGSLNVLLGYGAGSTITTGFQTVCIGPSCDVTTSGTSVATTIGNLCKTNGVYATAIGQSSTATNSSTWNADPLLVTGTAIGIGSIATATAGAYTEHVAISMGRTATSTTGFNNSTAIAIGRGVTAATTSASLSLAIGQGITAADNSIAIGTTATAGQARLGTSATTSVYLHSLAGNAAADPALKYITATKELTYSTSSSRYKTNIESYNITSAASQLMSLRPVSYVPKTNPDRPSFGFIAEEMNEVLPEIVFRNAEGLIEGIVYEALIAPIIATIQKQQSIIEELRNTIALL
jgi:hypothetical protein